MKKIFLVFGIMFLFVSCFHNVKYPQRKLAITIRYKPILKKIYNTNVYYARRYKHHLFFYDGKWYFYKKGSWYASLYYKGPYVLQKNVTQEVQDAFKLLR